MTVTVTKDQIENVIRGYQQEAEDSSDCASNLDIRKELSEEGEMPSHGQISEKTNEMKKEERIKRVYGDDSGSKKRWSTTDWTLPQPSVKRQIESARKELKNRILRQPKIEEVAEELGRENTEAFRMLFRKSVSDKWRSPDPEEIKEKKEDVQNRVEEALHLYLWPEELKDKIIENTREKSQEYYENNRELFEEFEIEVTKVVPVDIPRKFQIKAPPKLRKFMLETELEVDVPQSFREEEESTAEYHRRLTERIRDKIGYEIGDESRY
ncbi:hypothetical protein [Candidatus Nanohalobium constans]|uniref:Uncharacterized protein n=1 Tax=Candidatus Nanohalobium constans TaxID=2565781 RepID=A0A5Q0UGU8_9ARCH|nr:hypothetical protein [Candidatus Nanohalobium constans]QGA80883.1 hypothetical protein LC1Nh_1007 [Candidatus Nanohalobium constans]